MNSQPEPSAEKLTQPEITNLAVLGLLKLGPNHGYGLRAVLESWEIHRWLNVKYGAIYASLKRLATSGDIEVAAVEHARGPSRTVYQLTRKGEEELRNLTRRAWSEGPQWSLHIDLPLMYLGYDWVGQPILERDEVIGLLAERIAQLSTGIERLRGVGEQWTDTTDVDPLRRLQQAHFNHGVELLETELHWTEDLKTQLEQGNFDLPGS